MSCNNSKNEFGFFRSWSDVCRSCKQVTLCGRVAALSFVESCNIKHDPAALICMECKHRKLCDLHHSKRALSIKNHALHEGVIN